MRRRLYSLKPLSALAGTDRTDGEATTPLSVRSLYKNYALGDAPVEVLRGLSLELSPGELCAVMGPSGVGKSTLLNCIAGIVTADEGRIEVAGQDLTRMDDDARTTVRRDCIGVIYQFFNLVPHLTVEENILLPYLIAGEKPDGKAVIEALSSVGMSGRKAHLPSQLSGGEMQLVAIARALVRHPKIILADEPTGNVNVATGRRIMTLLHDVTRASSAAMLLVTHHPEDAARADRVEFMRDGAFEDEATLAGSEVCAGAIHDRLKELGI